MARSGVKSWKRVDPTGLTPEELRRRLVILQRDRRAAHRERQPHAHRAEVLGKYLEKLDALIMDTVGELDDRHKSLPLDKRRVE